MSTSFTVNGKPQSVNVSPNMSLLCVLFAARTEAIGGTLTPEKRG